MDKKVEQFKTDYDVIKERVKQIKQKLRKFKNDVKPTAKLAYLLYNLGDKSMYNIGKDGVIAPKTKNIPTMMNNLESWMNLDYEIQHAIESIL